MFFSSRPTAVSSHDPGLVIALWYDVAWSMGSSPFDVYMTQGWSLQYDIVWRDPRDHCLSMLHDLGGHYIMICVVWSMGSPPYSDPWRSLSLSPTHGGHIISIRPKVVVLSRPKGVTSFSTHSGHIISSRPKVVVSSRPTAVSSFSTQGGHVFPTHGGRLISTHGGCFILDLMWSFLSDPRWSYYPIPTHGGHCHIIQTHNTLSRFPWTPNCNHRGLLTNHNDHILSLYSRNSIVSLLSQKK